MLPYVFYSGYDGIDKERLPREDIPKDWISMDIFRCVMGLLSRDGDGILKVGELYKEGLVQPVLEDENNPEG